ncbi:hypothetical protein GCM10022224_101370 [Nonomuraea antimicrobica]|uniref:PPE family protein n=1 Tax=Nonomuraea antimicrobica TaxID=561173 RepID=A0ABP7EJY8_9ACTN
MAEPEKLSTPVVNTGKSLDTTVHDPTWWQSTTVDQNYIDRIKSWIDNTNPGAVRLAGLYYTAAEPLLVGFASDLKTKAGELAEAHKGPAAYEMQLQLRSLAASARELATKLADVGRSLTGYADTLVWAQQNVVETTYRDSRSDRDIDWAATLNPFNSVNRGNQRAVEYLKQVNQRIVEQYQQLPTEVQYALPDPNDIDMSDFGGIGAGGIGAGSGVPASYTGGGAGAGGYDGGSLKPGEVPGSTPGGAGGGSPSSPGQYPGAMENGGPGSGGTSTGQGGSDAFGGSDASGLTDSTLGGDTPGGVPSGSSTGSPSGDYGSTTLAGYDPSTGTAPGAANAANSTSTGNGTGPGMGAGTGVYASAAGSASGTSSAASAASRTGAGGMGIPAMGVPMSAQGKEEETTSESTSHVFADDDVWGGPEPGTTPSTLT